MANNSNAKKEIKLMGDMPHSLEAEQALLGCLLLDNRIQVEVAAFLKEEDFYAESHRYIFSATGKTPSPYLRTCPQGYSSTRRSEALS